MGIDRPTRFCAPCCGLHEEWGGRHGRHGGLKLRKRTDAVWGHLRGYERQRHQLRRVRTHVRSDAALCEQRVYQDTSTKKLNITPAYYVFRHFSQFVAPGATVVGTTGGDAVAFKNPDGSIVAIAYNSGSAKTMTVAIANKKLQFAMPGNGWATVVSR